MVSRLFSISSVIFTLMLSACGEIKYVDVSTKPGYRDLSGATYTVVGAVSAYGIRKHSKAEIEYITLIPPPGIGGSQIGFQIPITVGSTLTVMNVYETNRIFDPSVSLGVKLSGTVIPENLPIRIDLMRGNQGADKLSLNTAVYKRS
jgi:hypothetical protein